MLEKKKKGRIGKDRVRRWRQIEVGWGFGGEVVRPTA
jgi:hypothetical protein